MNLYELDGNLLNVVELASSAKPEDQQLFDDTIESLQDSIADKAIGYGKVIKQLVADKKQLASTLCHSRQTITANVYSLYLNCSIHKVMAM